MHESVARAVLHARLQYLTIKWPLSIRSRGAASRFGATSSICWFPGGIPVTSSKINPPPSETPLGRTGSISTIWPSRFLGAHAPRKGVCGHGNHPRRLYRQSDELSVGPQLKYTRITCVRRSGHAGTALKQCFLLPVSKAGPSCGSDPLLPGILARGSRGGNRVRQNASYDISSARMLWQVRGFPAVSGS
jgi:hypothetical protein